MLYAGKDDVADARFDSSVVRAILEGEFQNIVIGKDEDPVEPIHRGQRMREAKPIVKRIWPQYADDAQMITHLLLDARGDIETRVARKFKIPPVAVATVARKRLGRSLTAMRSISTRSTKLSSADRGHITRKLIRRIEPELSEVAASLNTKKSKI